MTLDIAIVGAGGAGGYFGARWAEAGHRVMLVARGAHLEAIRQRGLRIESPLGDATVELAAVDDPREGRPVDLVVIATKTWQLEEAIARVGALVGPGTVLFGVQNGVDSASILAKRFGAERVLGGTCKIISFIAAPGVVRHLGVPPILHFGEMSGGLSDRVAALGRELDLGEKLEVVATDEIEAELWKKLLFFVPVSGMGSVTRAPIGVVRSQGECRALLEAAMHEVLAVALARGVELPADSVERAMAFVDTLPFEGTSSMQRDFEAGRRTELEALAGAVTRIGREHGIPTPVHDFVHGALLPLERKARGELEW